VGFHSSGYERPGDETGLSYIDTGSRQVVLEYGMNEAIIPSVLSSSHAASSHRHSRQSGVLPVPSLSLGNCDGRPVAYYEQAARAVLDL
jgi:hypothetical protein